MSKAAPSVFVHIVSWNSGPVLEKCVRSVLSQARFLAPGQLEVLVTDNASSLSPLPHLREIFGAQVRYRQNSDNLGFCAAHNQGIFDFLSGSCDYFCTLNPDVFFEGDVLGNLCRAFATDSRIGLATPLLLRANEDLGPILPLLIDAAGMQLHSSLRHLDRGSGEPWSEQYSRGEYVFGGTGACLLLARDFVSSALVPVDGKDEALFAIYPQLSTGRESRAPLFDEAFFAYREDADLAWRAQNLGWKCRYVPEARAYHRRVVVPERRSSLPAALNYLSVRNRFLLQLNNYSVKLGWRSVINGLILRNLMVLLGVMTSERSSLPALFEALRLKSRALSRRRSVFKRAMTSN